jgi:tRNA-2-methylthio-N6-dimethylallyladenosine synthase
MAKKVFIKTFGCQMNEYDSDKMADVLGAAQGYEPTQNVDEADLILFNTCSVREKAQEKCSATWAASSTSRRKAC